MFQIDDGSLTASRYIDSDVNHLKVFCVSTIPDDLPLVLGKTCHSLLYRNNSATWPRALSIARAGKPAQRWLWDCRMARSKYRSWLQQVLGQVGKRR